MSVPMKIKIGVWTASPSLNLLENGDRTIKLEPRTMDVLVCLARHAGDVVPIGELLADVWQGVVVSDHSVYIAIKQLRKAFATAAEGANYIDTIPKRGYRLVANVENLVTLGDDGQGARDDAPAIPAKRSPGASWSALGFVAVAAACVLWLAAPTRDVPSVADRPATPIRFSVPAPGRVYGLAVSADGQRLAYAAGTSPATTLLYVRDLSSLESSPLAGTDGAQQPFWSADGKHIGFAVPEQGWLKSIALDGGTPRNVARTPVAGGAAWTEDGVIVFDGGDGLQRVPAAGGEQTQLTALATAEVAHSFPAMLNGSSRFLFAVVLGAPGVYAQTIGSAERVRISAEASTTAYASGHLLFNRGGALLAQPFDPKRLVPLGESTLVADGIATLGAFGSFAVSQNGVLAYVAEAHASAPRMQRSRLVWFDRRGQRLATVGEPGLYRGIALAPDGRRIAVHVHEEPAGGNIWILDEDRETFTRLTFGKRHDVSPLWSRDGDAVVFGTDLLDVYRKSASGVGAEEHLLGPLRVPLPTDWSADGTTVLVTHTPANHWDVAALPLATPRALVPTLSGGSGVVAGAKLSPDGHWIAYVSNESGTFEVYVTAYPERGTKRQLTTAGGAYPRWSADGREIFYLGADGTLMAVAVKADSDAFEHGKPQALFRADFMIGNHNVLGNDVGFGELPHAPFDVSADGRFLINERVSEDAASERVPSGDSITVVVDWIPELGG
jgi:DNA-binding winged helix-turn-helix (wHTH) protein/Tol biopolymer transport system component